jgi:hypothetical protein
LEPEAPSPPNADHEAEDAVLRAAHATLRAEQWQRAQAQAASVEQVVATIPDISQHKRDFLKSNPQFLFDGHQQQLMRKHYQAALAAGVEDDTPEIDKAVLEGVARDVELHRQALAKAARRPEPQPALAPQPLPAIRAGIPMTAPVSRDVPAASGQRAADLRTVTLTAEERLIARNSFSAPDMSNEEKEMSYARQKARMLQMRASGLLNE